MRLILTPATAHDCAWNASTSWPAWCSPVIWHLTTGASWSCVWRSWTHKFTNRFSLALGHILNSDRGNSMWGAWSATIYKVDHMFLYIKHKKCITRTLKERSALPKVHEALQVWSECTHHTATRTWDHTTDHYMHLGRKFVTYKHCLRHLRLQQDSPQVLQPVVKLIFVSRVVPQVFKNI